MRRLFLQCLAGLATLALAGCDKLGTASFKGIDITGNVRLALRHSQNAQDYASDLRRILQST